jgi:isochorismate hydrolase
MILASDAVAEVSRAAHASEVRTMQRVFADVMTTEEIIAGLRPA